MGNATVVAKTTGTQRALSALAALVLVACNLEVAGPRPIPNGGTGGVSQEFMGAGGVPPIGGMSGGGESGGMTGGGPPPAGMVAPPTGGTGGGMVVGGEGSAGAGGGPIEDRVFDAGSDPARNMVQPGALCDRLAQIQCAGEAYCCPNPGRDVAACQQAMRGLCVEEAFLDAISSNGATAFNAETAKNTFEELERLASICDPAIVSFSLSREGFMSMFLGTLREGDSCRPAGTDSATAAAMLAACTDITTNACLPTSVLSWRCAPRGPAGAECFTDVNCHDGLYCPNLKLEFGDFKCEARKGEGQPCTWGNECASLFCTGGVCVPPSQEGAYCLAEQM